MRIGILTYHSVYNFGANLQVLSTVSYLKNNRFEPIVINWVPRDLEDNYNRAIPETQANIHKKFLSEFLPCTEICRTENDIIHIIENYNIKGIIIGSDAVLRHSTYLSRIRLSKKGIIQSSKPSVDSLYPNPFWGSFIPELKDSLPVIMMSASSQNSNYKFFRGSLKKNINESLSRFNLITVRDEWTSRMLKYITNGRIIPSVTPDPVFGFNQNVLDQYTKDEIRSKFNLPEKYLLFSFADSKVVSKEWLSQFQNIAQESNLHCVALATPAGIKFDNPLSLVIDIPICPKEWFGIIKYSSGYIGENMHPIVVALHNAVPFYSFDAYGIVKFKFFINEKSSKIYDILLQGGFLQNRISRLGKAYKYPSPQEVFQKIKDFDILKCQYFSDSQLNRYNAMMKNITCLFTELIKKDSTLSD